MTWYSVYNTITGALHSIGTVLGEQLPTHFGVLEHQEEPNPAHWDPASKSYVAPTLEETNESVPAVDEQGPTSPAEQVLVDNDAQVEVSQSVSVEPGGDEESKDGDTAEADTSEPTPEPAGTSESPKQSSVEDNSKTTSR